MAGALPGTAQHGVALRVSIRTQPTLGRKPRGAQEAKRDLHTVYTHQLTYFTVKRGSATHIPGLVTTKLLTVLTSLIIRLPSPEKIRGNKSKGEKKGANS